MLQRIHNENELFVLETPPVQQPFSPPDGAETDSLEQPLQALWLVNHDLVSVSREQRDAYSYTGMNEGQN